MIPLDLYIIWKEFFIFFINGFSREEDSSILEKDDR